MLQQGPDPRSGASTARWSGDWITTSARCMHRAQYIPDATSELRARAVIRASRPPNACASQVIWFVLPAWMRHSGAVRGPLATAAPGTPHFRKPARTLRAPTPRAWRSAPRLAATSPRSSCMAPVTPCTVIPERGFGTPHIPQATGLSIWGMGIGQRGTYQHQRAARYKPALSWRQPKTYLWIALLQHPHGPNATSRFSPGS